MQKIHGNNEQQQTEYIKKKVLKIVTINKTP